MQFSTRVATGYVQPYPRKISPYSAELTPLFEGKRKKKEAPSLSRKVLQVGLDHYFPNRLREVVSVYDGDTLSIAHEEMNIRLYGIDANELRQKYGKESQEYLEAMVKGKKVSIAARNGNVAALNTLLAHLDKVEMDSEKRQAMVMEALGTAISEGKSDVVDAFFKHKDGLTADGKPQPQLIFKALYAREVRTKMVDFLIERGIDVNCTKEDDYRRGETPLIIATQFKRPELVDKLIAAGADIQARDKSGWSALMYAKDTSSLSHRKRRFGGKKDHDAFAQHIKDKGGKLNALDRAKLFAAYWNPFCVLGRGLDNLFGDIHF